VRRVIFIGPKSTCTRPAGRLDLASSLSPRGAAISDWAAFAMTGSVTAEGEVSTLERFPTSTGTKCPACGSATVNEVPAGGGTGIRAVARRVEHLWSCEQCRNQFRLVETSDGRHETHFD
jgi:ribosomal protein L37AE/L43A